MNLGLCLYGTPPDEYAPLAEAAERSRFESVWLADHLLIPASIETPYPYSANGESDLSATTPFIDPWIALSFVAAATETIRLGTFIYILPLRDPFVTAKTVGSLDALSGGRVLLGAGMGWLKEEFDIVGQEFAGRGRRALEAIEVMRGLWTTERYEHHGAHYDFGPVGVSPLPVQRPIPILLGGHSPAALRRAAAAGSGWIGSPKPADLLGAFLEEVLPPLRDQLADRGVGENGFSLTAGTIGVPSAEQLEEYRGLGLDRLIVGPWLDGSYPGRREAAEEQIEALGADLG